MRTETHHIYKFHELTPDAQEHAIECYRESIESDPVPWAEELFDSLQAIFEESYLTLKDYSLGMYSHSYVKFDMDDDIAELSGLRALTWLENNLLCNARTTEQEYRQNLKDCLRYGYRIGQVKPCPFTGVCYDDDFLDHLIESINSGMCLKDAYSSLADKYQSILESEYEYSLTSDACKDQIRANEYEFYADGSMY
jgi:hypothetical protein